MQQSANTTIARFGVALAAAMCLSGSLLMGFFLTRIFLEARASADWPTTAGILRKAEVARTSVNFYYADVAYTYAVAGNAYSGSRIAASDGEYKDRDGAVQALQGLQVGQPVTVYYNPVDPDRSVLRPGAGLAEYILLCLPSAVFCYGIYLVRLLNRTRRRRDPGAEAGERDKRPEFMDRPDL